MLKICIHFKDFWGMCLERQHRQEPPVCMLWKQRRQSQLDIKQTIKYLDNKNPDAVYSVLL